MKRTTAIKTQVFDLDWNRHITSRTYEKFCYAARWNYLESFGISIRTALEKGFKLMPKQTFVKFLAQQYEGSTLSIETDCKQADDGTLQFKQTVFDSTEKKSCELISSSILYNEAKEAIFLPEVEGKTLSQFDFPNLTIKERDKDQKCLDHSFYIPFSDMSCFWLLSSESVWKVFEEGRFLFFKEVFDLEDVQKTDTSTFFMGGEIDILTLPEPGSQVRLLSWIESYEKIRFFFRQDLLDSSGNVLVRMRDEQLFVSFSKARPKKSPPEFIDKTKMYWAKEA